jgi:RNA-binding protein NOB1
MDGKEECEGHNDADDNNQTGTDLSISAVSHLLPLTLDKIQNNTEDKTEEYTQEELKDLEFPSLSVNESKNSSGSLGPRYASNWVAVAMKDSSKPFSNKMQQKEVPQILSSPLQDTDIPPLQKLSATKSIIGSAKEIPDGMSMPSKIIGGSSSGHSAAASARAALEDDGEGWFNSSNFKTALEICGQFPGENFTRKKVLTEQAKVACITTDFSMQNVMLQMGLHLVSVDGLAITTVKQWVLRCMACYQVHYKMDLLFCEKCGANHMSRVSCSIDAETGLLKLHLKKNYQPNTRGKIYSLPKPGKQGRYEGEILLRGDQLQQGIWLQKKMAVQRNLKSAFGEDVTADVGLHVNKGVRIKVGLGSRNPNAEKGRERRGKPKK